MLLCFNSQHDCVVNKFEVEWLVWWEFFSCSRAMGPICCNVMLMSQTLNVFRIYNLRWYCSSVVNVYDITIGCSIL
jgi:hypothetical protein